MIKTMAIGCLRLGGLTKQGQQGAMAASVGNLPGKLNGSASIPEGFILAKGGH